MKTKTKNPDGLGPAGLKFYEVATATYQLDSPALVVLLEACHALDIAALAREELKRSGVTLKTSRGFVENPAVKTMRGAQATALSACRLLGIALPVGGS